MKIQSLSLFIFLSIAYSSPMHTQQKSIENNSKKTLSALSLLTSETELNGNKKIDIDTSDVVLSIGNISFTKKQFELFGIYFSLSNPYDIANVLIIAQWLDKHGISETKEYQRDVDSMDSRAELNFEYFARNYPLLALSKKDYDEYILKENQQDVLKKYFTVVTMKTIKIIGDQNHKLWHNLTDQTEERLKQGITFEDATKKLGVSIRTFELPVPPNKFGSVYIYSGNDTNWFENECPIYFGNVGKLAGAAVYKKLGDNYETVTCITYVADVKLMQQSLPTFEELSTDQKYTQIKAHFWQEIKKNKSYQLKDQAIEQIKKELQVKEKSEYFKKKK